MRRLLVLVMCLGLALSLAPSTSAAADYTLFIQGNLNVSSPWLATGGQIWVVVTYATGKVYHTGNSGSIKTINNAAGAYHLTAVISCSDLGSNGKRLFFHVYAQAFDPINGVVNNFWVQSGTQSVYATCGGSDTFNPFNLTYPNGAGSTSRLLRFYPRKGK